MLLPVEYAPHSPSPPIIVGIVLILTLKTDAFVIAPTPTPRKVGSVSSAAISPKTVPFLKLPASVKINSTSRDLRASSKAKKRLLTSS